MTETGAKPPSDMKARVAKVRDHIKATYQHYRHEIAHHHILSNLPPEYRTMLGHLADTVNSTCQNAGVRLIPEDVVIILASAMLVPLSYFTYRKTYLFHLAFHTYFVFIYPVMISLYDAESGDNAAAGTDLVGWVLISLWTVLERAVPNGERGYERLWYLVLKCGFAYGLFNPKLDGAAALVRLVVRPRIMPALGIDGGGGVATKKAKAATATTKEKKKTADPSTSSSAAAAKSKDAPAAAAATTEESDASTQDSKESSGFSFVEKSELEHEQEEQQPKTFHLKIESIEGTDWKHPAGGEAAFEGPYLVFDVIDKSMDDVSEFLPPSHAETVLGKKVRTPTGVLVEKEEEKETKEEAAEKVEEGTTQEADAEPELTEEGAEKDSEEKEGNDDEQAAEGEETEEKADANEGGSEEDTEESAEKEEKAEVSTEEKTEEESDAKAEEEREEEKSAEEAGKEVVDEDEEETTAAPVADSEEKEEKPEKLSASFSWPGTSLSVPVVLPPCGKGEGAKDPPQRLLRVVAYDKRAIGSDAFFGVAYAAAPIGEEDDDDDEKSKVEALVLRDGRTKADEGGTAEVGSVSVTLSCS